MDRCLHWSCFNNWSGFFWELLGVLRQQLLLELRLVFRLLELLQQLEPLQYCCGSFNWCFNYLELPQQLELPQLGRPLMIDYCWSLNNWDCFNWCFNYWSCFCNWSFYWSDFFYWGCFYDDFRLPGLLQQLVVLSTTGAVSTGASIVACST